MAQCFVYLSCWIERCPPPEEQIHVGRTEEDDSFTARIGLTAKADSDLKIDSISRRLRPSPDISPDWVIIHDMGGSDSNASSRHEIYELEFDRALEFTPKVIVIEPQSLRDATAR